MDFYVEQRVLDLGVKICFAEVRGLDNRRLTDAWLARRDLVQRELAERYRGIDIHADPILEGFNILHDHAGVRRKHNVPASVTLIKLLEKRGPSSPINQVVDIYNTVSLASKLALGAHDTDRTSGDVTLRITDGTERYVPLGETEPVPVAAGEYSYCDDEEVLCRLEVRQVNKTAVNEDTTNVWFIVQGNEATTAEYVVTTAQQLVEQVTTYCGGTGAYRLPETI